jgi:hypothetical protein
MTSGLARLDQELSIDGRHVATWPNALIYCEREGLLDIVKVEKRHRAGLQEGPDSTLKQTWNGSVDGHAAVCGDRGVKR